MPSGYSPVDQEDDFELLELQHEQAAQEGKRIENNDSPEQNDEPPIDDLHEIPQNDRPGHGFDVEAQVFQAQGLQGHVEQHVSIDERERANAQGDLLIGMTIGLLFGFGAVFWYRFNHNRYNLDNHSTHLID